MSKITAMIPARIGSERLKKKNLVLVEGKPIIAYTIEACLKSKVFDRVVLNSDDEIFAKIAKQYGIEFYLRPKEFGSSETRSDTVVNDFIENHPGEITAWVNPTSPLQTNEELKCILTFFKENKLDSLITTYSENVHCNYKSEPINYNIQGEFEKTQNLTPIKRFVYNVMAWRNSSFQREFEKNGYAILCGKFGTFDVSKESAMILKTIDDLNLISFIIKERNSKQKLNEDSLKYFE